MPEPPPYIAPVEPQGPHQESLAFPDPPARPFYALARHSRVGKPLRKLVYMILASYCPVTTFAWTAKGTVRRETLRQACEIGTLDTLDDHLRALREGGFVDWRRTRGASIYEVKLSPLRVLDAMNATRAQFGQDAAGSRLEPPVQGDFGNRDTLALRGTRTRATADTLSQGDSAGSGTLSQGESGGSDSPPEGGSGAPREPETPRGRGVLRRKSGRRRREPDTPGQGGSHEVQGRRVGRVTVSQGGSRAVPTARVRGSDSPSRTESRTPSPTGTEVATEVGAAQTAAAARALAVAQDDSERSSSDGSLGLLGRRLKLLQVAADRLHALGAAHLWAEAPPDQLQAQISAAVQFRDGHRWERHSHEVDAEILVAVGVKHTMPSKTTVQRCACGAVRFVTSDRSGSVDVHVDWTLCGLVARHVTDEAFYISEPAASLRCAPVPITGWESPFDWSDIKIKIEKQEAEAASAADAAPTDGGAGSGSGSGSPSRSRRRAALIADGLVVCSVCRSRVKRSDVGEHGCVMCLNRPSR